MRIKISIRSTEAFYGAAHPSASNLTRNQTRINPRFLWIIENGHRCVNPNAGKSEQPSHIQEIKFRDRNSGQKFRLVRLADF